METKVKEEIIDKEYLPSSTERRQSAAAIKEQPSPEAEDSRASPAAAAAGAGPGAPASPPHNGGAALSSTESLSPPLPDGVRSGAALQRLRRFLSALHQFAGDAPGDAGDRVRLLIHNLVAGTLSIEEFQCYVQEASNYPLRASVPRFLRALLPLAQRTLAARARRANQTPLQYIRSHEHLVLEAAADAREPGDFFAHDAAKRFYETNGCGDEEAGPAKRAASAASCGHSLPSNASLFEAAPHACMPPVHDVNDRRDGGRGEDEWRNIHTMLNCILSMVEKTKRALAILQHRGVDGAGGAGSATSAEGDKRAADALAACARHAEERVHEVRRRAEDAVLQVKRQALSELQRAALAAQARALDLLADRAPPAALAPLAPLAPLAHTDDRPPHQNSCWNCGRAAHETCSGCNAARYCGAFCQHRDWHAHHQVCSGREQKAALRTSPPAPPPPAPPRAATPAAAPPLSLSADRLPLTAPERLALAAVPNNAPKK